MWWWWPLFLTLNSSFVFSNLWELGRAEKEDAVPHASEGEFPGTCHIEFIQLHQFVEESRADSKQDAKPLCSVPEGTVSGLPLLVHQRRSGEEESQAAAGVKEEAEAAAYPTSPYS